MIEYTKKGPRKVRAERKKEWFPANYSATKAILTIMLDWADRPMLFETPLQRLNRRERQFDGTARLQRWRYNMAIKYLEHAAAIKTREKGGRLFLKLTRKGKVRALLNRLDQDFREQRQWDGKWRLIIWDIPEKARPERDKIRNFVKGLNFFQLQKSVFITPYQLPQSAVDYLRESDLLKFIRFLRVDKIENDRYLKKYFDLKIK